VLSSDDFAFGWEARKTVKSDVTSPTRGKAEKFTPESSKYEKSTFLENTPSTHNLWILRNHAPLFFESSLLTAA